MRGLLFLNGEPPKKSVLEAINYREFFTVCADGAFNYLKNYCIPDILIGDFDSLNDDDCINNPSHIKAKKIIRLKREKDFTDGHIALEHLLDLGADFIEIYGALNGRGDHELANYSLLALAREKNVNAVIRGEQFDIYLASAPSFSLNTKIDKIISLVPFSDNVHILSTRGLKYQIFSEVFNKLHIKGISNLSTQSEIEIKIQSGLSLVFVEKGE